MLWSRQIATSTPPQPTATGNGPWHDWMQMDDEEIFQLAKSNLGSKMIHREGVDQEEFRKRFIRILTSGPDYEKLARLAMDGNANFILQKMIEIDPTGAAPLLDALKKIAVQLATNRYGCRVLQKAVMAFSSDEVSSMLTKEFAGHEFVLVTDKTANRVIQHIVSSIHPQHYIGFISALIKGIGLRQVVENKYGCWVMQSALEQAVNICKEHKGKNQPKDAGTKSAFALLHLLLVPILEDVPHYANNECANYIVQSILKNSFLDVQRRHIIRKLVDNVLVLAQGKFSSHVMEVAISHADDECLKAIFLTILRGYEPDREGKVALHFMLFHQYGNYVVQRMLEVAIQIKLGRRGGDPLWYNEIVSYVINHRDRLSRYSSGQKIIDTISQSFGLFHLPMFNPSMMPPPLPQQQPLSNAQCSSGMMMANAVPTFVANHFTYAN